MPIVIRPKPLPDKTTVEISEFDAELIKRIYENCGFSAGVYVTKWRTQASIESCGEFVRGLIPQTRSKP